jgi:hypothetical protein
MAVSPSGNVVYLFSGYFVSVNQESNFRSTPAVEPFSVITEEFLFRLIGNILAPADG